jgi:outer membrane receptor protein involved in Fe transport
MALDQVPRNVQRVDRSVFDEEHPLGVQEALNLRLGSVVINDVQSNPLQPDVQYRGFTASPLLGSPQGLAVFQNGVRINDAFGEVVQWDLVPDFAIQEVQVMPGASPLYGLNALGGGIAIQMKDGYSAPGHRITALGGSFGRYQASAEYGHVFEDWALYAGLSAFGEQGFRDHSPSSAQHAYVDLRQRTSDHEVGINATIANTSLNGNGPVPIELLERSRHAVYTYPDNTSNGLLMVAADANSKLTDRLSLQGTAYVRHVARDTSNGDQADFETCDDADPARLCSEDGDRLRSETGHAIPAMPQIFDAVYNTTATVSDGYGGTLAANLDAPLLGRRNQLMVGASYDGSSVSFLQRVQLGYLSPDRGVVAENVFVDNDGFRTSLGVDNRSGGAFVADTLSISDAVSVQLAGRGGFSNVELDDRAGTALNGDHWFGRFNPAVGLTYNPLHELTLFVSYSESNRAPSAIELACADPEQPCRVPNAFLGDPSLAQVVTRAAELGARGAIGGSRQRPMLSWSLAGFGSRNFDDIIFVAGSRIGTGYFRNAGETQRIGLEAGLRANLGRVRLFASYSLLRATFESALRLSSEANPGANGDGTIDVSAGDRLPGLPTHSLKAGVSVFPLAGLDVGLTAIAQSSRPFRGDEANLIANVPGYAVLNAHAAYWLLENLQLFVKAQNLLNTKYETFGILADPSEVLRGTSDPRFVGVGAPLGVWAGLVVTNR